MGAAESLLKIMDKCPVYIGGQWRIVADAATTPVYNPSTGAVIAETPLCAARHVDEAVQAAAAAFPAWWETPAVERARLFFSFKALLERHFEELIRLNTREHGKTLA